jgi:hypothetical protein
MSCREIRSMLVDFALVSRTDLSSNVVPPTFAAFACCSKIREDYIRAKWANRAFHREQHIGSPPLPPVADTSPANPRQESVGMVEFGGVIMIHLKSAVGLRKADIMSDSDPYATIDVEGGSHQGQHVKSKTIQNSNSPKWNEHLQVCVESLSSNLHIKVFDEDDVVRACGRHLIIVYLVRL